MPITAFRLVFLITAFATVVGAQTKTDEGIVFYQNGEYDKAIVTLEKAVETNSGDEQARLYLGASYVSLGKDAEALRIFRGLGPLSKAGVPHDKSYEKALKVKKAPPPGYTRLASDNRISGYVVVAVEFRSDGTVGFIFPIQRLPDGLTEKAIEAARKIKFEPAMNHGKKVTVIRRIEYTFSSP